MKVNVITLSSEVFDDVTKVIGVMSSETTDFKGRLTDLLMPKICELYEVDMDFFNDPIYEDSDIEPEEYIANVVDNIVKSLMESGDAFYDENYYCITTYDVN